MGRVVLLDSERRSDRRPTLDTLRKLVETEQRSREATRRYYLATSGVEIPQKEALRRGLPIDQPG